MRIPIFEFPAKQLLDNFGSTEMNGLCPINSVNLIMPHTSCIGCRVTYSYFYKSDITSIDLHIVPVDTKGEGLAVALFLFTKSNSLGQAHNLLQITPLALGQL